MKKLLGFLILLVSLSSCALIETPVLSSASGGFIYPDIDNAIVRVCASAIERVETDRVQETLPLCVNRTREFFEYHDQSWLDSDQIYYVSLDIVKLWSDAEIKTYAEAYGCQRGCTIQFDNFPAAKILDVLQEEMVEMGNSLRSKGYVIPIYN